jgi:hypothetical protein
MTKKIITTGDIEFIETDQDGSLNFFRAPEFEPYNKYFKASVAYLPVSNACYKIIKWDFSADSDYKDERFPQYDVFQIGTEQTFGSAMEGEISSAIDLTESEFESWLIRTQLPVI